MKKFNKVNEVIDEKIFNNYVYASKLFNEQYVDEFRIDLFLNFQTLDIYLRNIKEHTSFKLEILNNCINDLSVNEIFESYKELLNKCYRSYYEKMEI